MKFLTQMKSCDVVTVDDGTIQAIKGPIAYFGYHPAFKKKQFAVDAKMFVAALKKFKGDFFVSQSVDRVVFADDQQEVDFVHQPAEILLDQSRIDWCHLPGFANAWNIAQKFISADFPGVRVEDYNYLEVVSDASIVRIATETNGINGIFASVKLPAGVKFISHYNNKLWFSVTPTDIIVVNALDVVFPTTNRYFNDWEQYTMESIPYILRERFVETDQTVFSNNEVQFVQKEKATAVVEGVSGTGTYSGKLFRNIIEHGQRYAFLDQFVAFESDCIKGIVARV